MLTSTHLRQNFLNSEDKIKIQLNYLFCLIKVCFWYISITICQRKKYIELKNKGLVTSLVLWYRFELKSFKKVSLLGEQKIPSCKIVSKVPYLCALNRSIRWSKTVAKVFEIFKDISYFWYPDFRTKYKFLFDHHIDITEEYN